MRKALFLAVACVLVLGSLGGCAIVKSIGDWLFLDAEGAVPGGNGATPGSILGSILNVLIPGAGAALALTGGIYGKLRGKQAKTADERGRKWKDALVSTVRTVEAVGATVLGEGENTALKKALASAHEAAGVQQTVNLALDVIGAPAKVEMKT